MRDDAGQNQAADLAIAGPLLAVIGTRIISSTSFVLNTDLPRRTQRVGRMSGSPPAVQQWRIGTGLGLVACNRQHERGLPWRNGIPPCCPKFVGAVERRSFGCRRRRAWDSGCGCDREHPVEVSTWRNFVRGDGLGSATLRNAAARREPGVWSEADRSVRRHV